MLASLHGVTDISHTLLLVHKFPINILTATHPQIRLACVSFLG